MEQSLNILISTLVALFAVWLITYLLGKIFARVENYLRAKRFKAIIFDENIHDIRVESFNEAGYPMSISFIANGNTKRTLRMV